MNVTTKQSVNISYPPNQFTFKDLEKLNPNISSQTLRFCLRKQLDGGLITKSDDVMTTGKRGRSQHVYIHGKDNLVV